MNEYRKGFMLGIAHALPLIIGIEGYLLGLMTNLLYLPLVIGLGASCISMGYLAIRAKDETQGADKQ